MKRYLILSALVFVLLANASAQIALPAFDVVSIKPYRDESLSRMGIWFNTTPDGLSFKGGSLDMLLRFAFDVPRDRLLNEPDWVKSNRIDLEAKVTPADAPKLATLTHRQRWAMVLPALEDRCHLKFHHQTRELQVYALVIAKGGAKLKEAKPSDDSAARSAPSGQRRPPQPPSMSASSKGMTIKADSATIDSLVQMLSQQLGTTVVDNTGLTGSYDYALSWMPDEDAWHLMGLPIPGPPPGENAQSQPQPAGPSLFSALEEQLGLKLEARKAAVDVIVIDNINPPSAN